MKAPNDFQHIPFAFLENIWSEFDKITWAQDERPTRIRLMYSTAITNAVTRYYTTPTPVVQKEEGAFIHDDTSTPSLIEESK